jgi:hypothetical protein
MEITRLPPDTREKLGQGRYATLYTRLQIRGALDMLCSLIIILRTPDGPIHPSRIVSHPLEHVFGKTRLRPREASAMRRFVSELPRILEAQSSHFPRADCSTEEENINRGRLRALEPVKSFLLRAAPKG